MLCQLQPAVPGFAVSTPGFAVAKLPRLTSTANPRSLRAAPAAAHAAVPGWFLVGSWLVPRWFLTGLWLISGRFLVHLFFMVSGFSLLVSRFLLRVFILYSFCPYSVLTLFSLYFHFVLILLFPRLFSLFSLFLFSSRLQLTLCSLCSFSRCSHFLFAWLSTCFHFVFTHCSNYVLTCLPLLFHSLLT